MVMTLKSPQQLGMMFDRESKRWHGSSIRAQDPPQVDGVDPAMAPIGPLMSRQQRPSGRPRNVGQCRLAHFAVQQTALLCDHLVGAHGQRCHPHRGGGWHFRALVVWSHVNIGV
jgi:hypothetical protein